MRCSYLASLFLLVSTLCYAAHNSDRGLYFTDIKNLGGSATILIPTQQPTASRVAIFDFNDELNSSTITTTNLALLGTATAVNSPSTLVERDSSGNFSAGTITASLTGNVTGNASGTASSLASIPTGCSSHDFATSIAANGNLGCAQPVFTDISGILSTTAGGTGASYGNVGAIFNAGSPLSVNGDLLTYVNGNTRLTGNATATRKFLLSVGNGVVPGNLAYTTLQTGDVPAVVAPTTSTIPLRSGSGITYSNGLGIGTNSTAFTFLDSTSILEGQVSDTVGQGASMSLYYASTHPFSSPGFNFNRSAGSIASPTKTLNGTQLGHFYFSGYSANGNAWVVNSPQPAGIEAYADGDWGVTGNLATDLYIYGTQAPNTTNGILTYTGSSGDMCFGGDCGTGDTGYGVYLGTPLGGTNLTVGIEGVVTSYNSDTTLANGFASIVGDVERTGQTASIAATTIYTPPSNGLFEVSCYINTTTTAVGSLAMAITWTDDSQAQTQSPCASLNTATTGSFSNGSTYIRAKNTAAIKYSTTLVGLATYSIFITVKRVK